MSDPTPAVLVADDDTVARDLLVEVLEREGYRVRAAAGGAEAIALAEQEPFDVALIDLRMPDTDGLAVLARLVTLEPAPTVLILTAFASMDTAVEAIRRGADDYLSKPFRLDDIKRAVRRTLEVRRLERDNQRYRRELRARFDPHRLVGQSPEIVAIYKMVARVAGLDTTVLIQGETGTGKELVARAIHYAGPRADRPFVVVDGAAIPEPLFESELFGHERGAFTGAVTTRRGLLETAHGGTCFLDEVSELTPALQAKLLRVLQDRVLRRVGGNEPIPVDVRVVAATNRDLRKRVEDGRFREDLYYRLNGVTITMPPLRERGDDVMLLAEHFARAYATAAGKRIDGFAPETLGLLHAHGWPGNVRELEHAIERAVALASSSLLLPEDLPPDVRADGARAPDLPGPRMTLDEVKRWYVALVLEEVGGNKVRAAEMLGIDRRTLYRILKHEADAGDG
jgi:two-component system, NtrC family, response regulator AtoC